MTDVLIFVRGDDVRTPKDIAEGTAERIIDAGFAAPPNRTGQAQKRGKMRRLPIVRVL